MALDAVTNFGYATLAAGIDSDDTSITLTTGHGARLPAGPFNAVIWDTSYSSPTAAYHASAAEIVRVTTRTTDTLSPITRAQEGTTARSFNTSGRVYAIGVALTKATYDALAPKDAAVLTGTTSVQVLSPDIADLGTAASGTVTLSSTKAVNKVILSGSAATIALPSSPPDGWRSLVASVTGNVALTVTTPSLYRLDDPALGTVTSVSIAAATAGKAIFSFLAIGGSYVGMTVIGDDSSIPSSKLAGLSTDGTNASPSNSTFLSSQAYATHLAATLDALTLPYTDINNFPTAKIAGRSTASTGALEAITVGTGLSLSAGTLSATATGSSTPVELTTSDIDWSAGGNFTDTIGANTTYTFSNTTDGQTIRALITASGAYSVTWPANVYGAPSQTSTATDLYQLTRFGGIVVCSRVSANMAIDITAPTYTSTTIPTNGLTFVDTYNETLHATIATTTGRTMTVNGVSITGSSPVVSGSTVTWTATPTIEAGTVSANAYTAPTNAGIKDSAGNFAATYSGRQADVTNNSTVSTYNLNENFTAGTAPAGTLPASATVSSGSVTWKEDTTFASISAAGITGGTYFTVGSDKTEQWFFLHIKTQNFANSPAIRLLNSGLSAQATIELRSDRINISHGTTTAGSGANATLYGYPSAESVIWIRYKAETTPGSSADGILQLYYNRNSTSETLPSVVPNAITTGTGDAIRHIVFDTPSGTDYVGKLRASDAAIGSNPT